MSFDDDSLTSAILIGVVLGCIVVVVGGFVFS